MSIQEQLKDKYIIIRDNKLNNIVIKQITYIKRIASTAYELDYRDIITNNQSRGGWHEKELTSLLLHKENLNKWYNFYLIDNINSIEMLRLLYVND